MGPRVSSPHALFAGAFTEAADNGSRSVRGVARTLRHIDEYCGVEQGQEQEHTASTSPHRRRLTGHGRC